MLQVPGDLVTPADQLVLPPVPSLTGPATVGHIATAPAGTGIFRATHVTGAHLRTLNLKSGFISVMSVMDDGQQSLAKVNSGGKMRLRPSLENRDYMVGGKRRRGEARERQVYTIHNSSSKQSLSTDRCDCDTSQSFTFYIELL